jgi:hypothetical protein
MKEIQKLRGNLNKYLISSRNREDGFIDDNIKGIQHDFKFENDFGASVINFGCGRNEPLHKWELAVLKFIRIDGKIVSSEIVTDTNITNDVMGWLSSTKVASTLRRIKRLK